MSNASNVYSKLNGKKAIITAQEHGHGFSKGDEVRLIHDESCDHDNIKGINEQGEGWWLEMEEFEVIPGPKTLTAEETLKKHLESAYSDTLNPTEEKFALIAMEAYAVQEVEKVKQKLHKLRGMEAWISDQEMKELFQITINSL